jgi:hypothetical protein
MHGEKGCDEAELSSPRWTVHSSARYVRYFQELDSVSKYRAQSTAIGSRIREVMPESKRSEQYDRVLPEAEGLAGARGKLVE